MINDKNIDQEQLKAIRRSLIFDTHINLSKLVKDHQWYIDQLNELDVKSTLANLISNKAMDNLTKIVPTDNINVKDKKDINTGKLFKSIAVFRKGIKSGNTKSVSKLQPKNDRINDKIQTNNKKIF